MNIPNPENMLKDMIMDELLMEGEFETYKEKGLPCAQGRKLGAGATALYTIYNKGELVEICFSSDKKEIIQKLKKLQEENKQ
jgi:hypothetical protein